MIQWYDDAGSNLVTFMESLKKQCKVFSLLKKKTNIFSQYSSGPDHIHFWETPEVALNLKYSGSRDEKVEAFLPGKGRFSFLWEKIDHIHYTWWKYMTPSMFISDKDPFPTQALPTCEYALNACHQKPGCSRVYHDYRRLCRFADDTCLMKNGWGPVPRQWSCSSQTPLIGERVLRTTDRSDAALERS